MKCHVIQVSVALPMTLFCVVRAINLPNALPEKKMPCVSNNCTSISKADLPSQRWNYKDTESWTKYFRQCGGSMQSPINIEPAETKARLYESFAFGNYAALNSVTITNSGHTVFVHMAPIPTKVPFIQGGGLTGRYNFIQFHFHWGNNSNHGSEHTIQNKRYAAELHLVHFNAKYRTFTEAVKHKDGLAVLAVLMEPSKRVNKAMDQVISQLEKVKRSGRETKIPEPIRLRDVLPANIDRFYRYSGSLTTPECQEIVTWTVFEKPSPISEGQLNKFRKLLNEEGKPLINNYRPVRKKGGRTAVYRNRAVNSLQERLPQNCNTLLKQPC